MQGNITTYLARNATIPTVPYWDVPGRVLLSLTLIVIMVMAIFGNALVILVIARNHGMQTRTNFFLMNLAFADFLCGCIDMPFSLITVIRGKWIFNYNVCQMNSFATPFFFVASIHTLMYIAIFKFFTIHNPFRFALSRSRILLMIGAAWGWATVIGTLSVVGLSKAEFEPFTTQCGPTYDNNAKSYAYFGILLITCYAIPLCVIAVCYTGMFREIRSHGRRLRDTSTIDREKIYAQQKGILVTLLVVVIAFLVTWTPWIIYSLYAILCSGGKVVVHWINPITFWFGYANSACNPVIYALRSQTFREGYKQIAKKRGPKAAGYQVAIRNSDGTHLWRGESRTESSFLHRTSTKEKSKFADVLPTRQRLSSSGSLPEGFVTGQEKQFLEYIPLCNLNGNSKPVHDTVALEKEPVHHHPLGSVRVGHRQSRRTRHHDEAGEMQVQCHSAVAAEKELEAAGTTHVAKRKSTSRKKPPHFRNAPEPRPSVKEVKGLAPNLKQWLISRKLGRETENPDIVEVFVDVHDIVELHGLKSSSGKEQALASNLLTLYSQSVCSLCSNPECEETDKPLHHRKSAYGHTKKSNCKKTADSTRHRPTKAGFPKPALCRFPSVDELDDVQPKRHVVHSGSRRNRNPIHLVEKWYQRHRQGLKPGMEREDWEQARPLNRNSSTAFDHVLPGMFRSSSAPCL